MSTQAVKYPISLSEADRPVRRPWVSANNAPYDLLRIWLCIAVFAHGAWRLFSQDPMLGSFLAAEGWPQGMLLAQLISALEVVCALMLLLRRHVLACCAILAVVYLIGIAIFHRKVGFFVVGDTDNGWEYPALLVTGLLAVAWEEVAAGGRWKIRHLNGLDLMRIVVCLDIAFHGLYRLFLNPKGPYGLGEGIEFIGLSNGLAWAVATCWFEILGGSLLLFRIWVPQLATGLFVIYAAGMAWFHWRWGFFVIAPGDFDFPGKGGWGWEFSAMLMISLAAFAWRDRDQAGLAWRNVPLKK